MLKNAIMGRWDTVSAPEGQYGCKNDMGGVTKELAIGVPKAWDEKIGPNEKMFQER